MHPHAPPNAPRARVHFVARPHVPRPSPPLIQMVQGAPRPEQVSEVRGTTQSFMEGCLSGVHKRLATHARVHFGGRLIPSKAARLHG